MTPNPAKISQSVSPIVQGIITRLQMEIAAGSLAPGEALPAERDLSHKYGVSRAVIRSAIQDLGAQGVLVLKERCRPVIAQTGRTTSRTNADHIAVWIWPRSNHYVGSQILKGIQTSMGQSRLRIVVGHAAGSSWDDTVESETAFLNRLIADESCAGAIIWYVGGSANRAALEKVVNSGVPLVFVDRLPEVAAGCDYVGTDNVGSACSAVSHLIELGHRRIACLTNLDHASSVSERIQGWREAHLRAGLPIDEALVINPRETLENRPEECYVEEQVAQLFSLQEPATAAFCINDTLAVSALDVIGSAGRKVPQDISLLGFDGLLSWMPGGGGLSGAAQNFERIGQTAVRLLMERIAKPTLPGRHVLLDAPLRLHGSTSQVVRRPDHALTGQIPNAQ